MTLSCSIPLLFPAKRATVPPRLVDLVDEARPGRGLALVHALRQRWEPQCGFAGKARRSSTRPTTSNHRSVVGVEQCISSPLPGRLDLILGFAFLQVRSTFRLGLRVVCNLLTPECTITAIGQAAIHDFEESLLGPALSQFFGLPRPCPVQPRSTVRADPRLLRRDVRNPFLCSWIADELQLRPGHPPVGGGYRRHHHLDPSTGHTPVPHVQHPLPDEPVHHPGRLRHGTSQQPRNRRIRAVTVGRHRPAHEPDPTIRPSSQHQLQQRQPLRRSSPALPSTK